MTGSNLYIYPHSSVDRQQNNKYIYNFFFNRSIALALDQQKGLVKGVWRSELDRK